MKRNGHAIGRGSHVGLNVAVTQCDRVLERGPTVLGGLSRPASVREGQRAGVLQEGKIGGHWPHKDMGYQHPYTNGVEEA